MYTTNQNNKTCLAYLFLIINNYGGLFQLFGIITCNAVLTFIFPASSLFCLVLQKTKEKRAFLSGDDIIYTQTIIITLNFNLNTDVHVIISYSHVV